MIGSRICHDLISPIGAIANGLELLDLTGAEQGPELDLIADSAGNAGARIRFFRVAFGAAGDQQLGRAEIVAILQDMTRGGRLRLDWRPEGACRRDEVRLAFLAILCCESALPQGGTVMVTREDGAWRLAARGEKLAVDEALWARLASDCPDTDLSPAQVQFALLPVVARDMARALAVATGAEEIAIGF